MGIFAYYGLHYGAEWLKHSMRSIRPFVDEVYVFYSSKPSHGHTTKRQNPESRKQLMEISKEFDVTWVDCPDFKHEGYHRDFAVDICANKGADLILVVDADEIWDPEHLAYSIEFAKKENYLRVKVEMIHFWRSVRWVCTDVLMPDRFVKPHADGGEYPFTYTDHEGDRLKVFHMGYAQTPKIVAYKQDIHGHKGEWRDFWFDIKFMQWKPGGKDVHPTCFNMWNPVEYLDDGTLEYLIGDHPYWQMDIIK